MKEVEMTQSIFITGASTGLGRATALKFAAEGWRVIATMRNPEEYRDLENIRGVELLKLDVCHPEEIATAVAAATAKSKIDVLFNNAGYGLAGPLEGATDEAMQRQLNTNLLGVLRVTKAFLPHFRENHAGLILTTTSIGGHMTFPFTSVYHATKWALEGWSESMAFELAPLGIRIKTIAPGGIKTDFSGRSLDLVPHPSYQSALEQVVGVFMEPERMNSGSTAEQIADEVYQAVNDPSDQVSYIAGDDAQLMYGQRQELGAEAFRQETFKTFFGTKRSAE